MKDGFISLRESKEAVQVAFSLGAIIGALTIAIGGMVAAYMGIPL